MKLTEAQWRLAHKLYLGNVWHIDRGNQRARCDRRIRLFGDATCEPGTASNVGYVCKRCRILSEREAE